MIERRKSREQALHILYQREITGESLTQILGSATYNAEGGEPTEFCRRLLTGVEAEQNTIDDTIERLSEHWTLARMPLVDRNILRLAVYEILYEEDVPASVAINEAVELAKAYGGDDSSKFVNGVLGRLAEQHSASRDGTDGFDE